VVIDNKDKLVSELNLGKRIEAKEQAEPEKGGWVRHISWIG
jgi:hypothetical protein